MQYIQHVLSVLLVAFWAHGCTPSDLSSSAQHQQLVTDSAFSQAKAYHLGSGDKLRLIVFGEPDLSGEFVVDDQGNLDLPLVGDVAAKNKSLGELEDAIVVALKDGYLKDPRISLEVLNYRPFFIQGEIGKPGEYPYKNGLTLQDAVAIAGGYSYRANTKRVFIRKNGNDYDIPVKLTGARVYIQPGDSIRVPERFF
ncbi:polysaccharide export outer membrane protein [Pseudovibrio denitrificans]|uniref:Polysaccharide export outer membrane protein n=1 Tax=Pseudovibrio denitrificans TaxID=258256 RepID=A0A1I7CMH9_9HYPH|nr:polysaccharide biosynthesis/export family protein [Pseudovibrio denitrificans]SFU00635.1 polysaccharide export outer membrane protein [Pseudovibrio denitrificans]